MVAADPARPDAAPALRGRMVPFRAMSVRSEAPAAFRNAAGNPGALRSIREGIDDIVSRRRLVRYLVQADMRKRGADTLLGNFWWVLDPLLQMLVYWVFVSIIVQRNLPDYPAVHLRRDPALEMVHRLGRGWHDGRVQPGPAGQADRSSRSSSCRSRRRPPASSASPSGSSRWPG